jgi:hypothetical protein
MGTDDEAEDEAKALRRSVKYDLRLEIQKSLPRKLQSCMQSGHLVKGTRLISGGLLLPLFSRILQTG